MLFCNRSGPQVHPSIFLDGWISGYFGQWHCNTNSHYHGDLPSLAAYFWLDIDPLSTCCDQWICEAPMPWQHKVIHWVRHIFALWAKTLSILLNNTVNLKYFPVFMQTLDCSSYAILNIKKAVLFLQTQATLKIHMQSQNVISIMIAVWKISFFLKFDFTIQKILTRIRRTGSCKLLIFKVSICEYWFILFLTLPIFLPILPTRNNPYVFFLL